VSPLSSAAPTRDVDATEGFGQPTRKHIAAMLVDISGYVAFAETIEPEILFAMLRDFHGLIGRVVEEHGGTVINFVADTSLMIFDGPLATPDPELRAVRAAIALRERFDELAIAWNKQGFDLDLRIGLHAGFATVGLIGYPGRLELGVIGRTVNTTVRIAGQAKPGQTLASERFLAAVDERLEVGAFSEVALRGLARPLKIAEILRRRGA